MTLTAALHAEGLSKSFGGVHALKGVDVAIPQGKTLGLLGPNGSGKTTLVNCLSGVLTADAGTITMNSRNITSWSRIKRARAGLVRTYQNLRLFADMTVAENISIGLATTRGLSRSARDESVSASIAMHDLGSIARMPVRGLSYGQQRRVEIARALIAAPKVLLLDEPAAGLGERDTHALRESLTAARQEFGSTMVLIDHDVDFVISMSDEVAVLHEGAMIRRGLPDVIQNDPVVAEIYLGTQEETHD